VTTSASDRITFGGRLLEIGRPVVLFGLFVWVATAFPWWAALPVALAAVFAWSILVHDLLHSALRLPRWFDDVAVGVSALFLLKSGHALRTLHLRHHSRCLDKSDVEGRVAFAPLHVLLAMGPWLALEARLEAFRADASTRRWQVAETVLDAALLAAIGLAAWRLRHPAPLVYLASVALITVTAPIWGAKIPHAIPYRHPLVRRIAKLTGRFTPAVASVVLHELHHRRPTLLVAMLPAHQNELDTTNVSRCERRKAGSR
jgi:fatty acid desaturase